ncbi:hypothetical protein [Stenotrophomonas sp.]|uniref:hypothetical protein n=1 Tax=Stenotrophomonas sp. TaxID=69392 RepID=UPI0028ACECE9|nr:hypothetical protein [Stenotrophomonas sp.]
MAVDHRRLSTRLTNAFDVGGRGYLAGTAPSSSDPAALDGRFKKMNVPGIGRIVAMERSSLRIVGATLSRADGTWRIGGLALGKRYLVMGFDDRGLVNAAIQDWVLPAEES